MEEMERKQFNLEREESPDYLKGIMVICGILVLFFLFKAYVDYGKVQDNIKNYETLTSPNPITFENCSNLSLNQTAACLIRYVKPYYHFNIRSDINRSIEDILQKGGDCWDYAHLYVKLAESLGYQARVELFSLNETDAHAFAFVWGHNWNDGYCIIDELNLRCVP